MIDEFSGYATTVNGVIKYCGIGILTQPESTVVTEGSPVQLNAQSTLFGAAYQWQAFILGEWVNLQDNSAYNGTNNNVLSIAAAYGNMTFRCVISFQGCSVTTNEVTVQTTVGVDEAPSLYLSIFPNPAMENLTVEIPNELIGEDVIIYDVAGREIYRSTTTNTINLINVAELSSGSYFLRVGDLSVKVVK
jgi:hypothetical protein